MEKVSEWSNAEAKLVLTIESHTTYRLEAMISGGAIKEWALKENGNGPAEQNGILVRMREEIIFECQVPLKMIGAVMGTVLRIRFSVWNDRLPLDALPEEGSIEVQVVPRSSLTALAYAKP